LPRRQYPSDHRPYFRVLEDILDDDGLQDASADQYRAFIQLLATLNRTGSTDGRLTLGQMSLRRLVHKNHDVYARKLVRSLQEVVEIEVEFSGTSTLIYLPKWPIIQGFTTTELRPDSDATPPLRVEESREEENRQTTPPSPAGGGEETTRKKPKPDPPPEAIRLADLWADLRQHHRGTKRPSNLTTWRNDLRKLIENDGKPAPEVERVIQWLYGENLTREYQFQCHSPSNLRRDGCEKYDRIRTLMDSNGGAEREDARVTRARARYRGKAAPPSKQFTLDNPPTRKDEF
jgi:hypothetical protein